MFVNGVELANYKSRDAIYYGELEGVNVLNGGSGHDVINPPELLITDNAGVGATGHVNVKGSFDRIDVKYAGFDYLEQPQITISGGNGVDAKAEAKMKQGIHAPTLDVEVGIDTSDNIIGFTTNLVGVGIFCYTFYWGVVLSLRILQDTFHLNKGLDW